LPTNLRLPQSRHDPEPVEQARAEAEHRIRPLGLRAGGGHRIVPHRRTCSQPQNRPPLSSAKAKIVLRIPPEGWNVPPILSSEQLFLLPKLVETACSSCAVQSRRRSALNANSSPPRSKKHCPRCSTVLPAMQPCLDRHAKHHPTRFDCSRRSPRKYLRLLPPGYDGAGLDVLCADGVFTLVQVPWTCFRKPSMSSASPTCASHRLTAFSGFCRHHDHCFSLPDE
jgi:hypothetical protein